MSWELDALRAHLWITEFVNTLVKKTDNLDLVEVFNFPSIDIPVYRVFKDQFQRWYYFSLVGNDLIQEFCERFRLYGVDIKEISNTQFPRKKVTRVTVGTPNLATLFLFCHPKSAVLKRNPGK